MGSVGFLILFQEHWLKWVNELLFKRQSLNDIPINDQFSFDVKNSGMLPEEQKKKKTCA